LGSMVGKSIRGLSGAVAAGVVVLTLVVIGAMVLGNDRDFPGPGVVSITWHIVTAVAVVIAQVIADRRRGFVSFAASVVVIGLTGLLLWTQWWT
jgi:hypothetical protein